MKTLVLVLPSFGKRFLARRKLVTGLLSRATFSYSGFKFKIHSETLRCFLLRRNVVPFL